jgi:hypothetical protein
MPLCEPKYKYGQTIVREYNDGCGNRKLKLTTMNVLRTSGVENDSFIYTEKGSVNGEKSNESLVRTKSRVFELSFCNPWELFFTGTLSPVYDRENLGLFKKTLTQWVRDYRKKHDVELKYILIPEKHADGKTWHMHGFLMGLPVEHLKQFVLGDKMGYKLAERVKQGKTVYNWLAYADKFGWVSLEPIESHEGATKYMTKYINKSLEKSVTQLEANKYYRSQNLRESTVIAKGVLTISAIKLCKDPVEDFFKNDYCSVAWLEYSDELLETLKNSIVKG